MTERPILFSAQMVCAILDDRKTQTRRVVKPQPDDDAKITMGDIGTSRGIAYIGNERSGGLVTRVASPYGQPGDRLWVRETWAHDPLDTGRANYRANYFQPMSDFPPGHILAGADRRWRPSIFMPRWASRITLEVTGVRVERLQDISDVDAIAEGLRVAVGGGTGRGPGYKWTGTGYEGGKPGFYHVPHPDESRCNCKLAGSTPAQCAYRELWDQINAKRAPWASNPWVWVIEFKRVRL